MIQSSLEVTVFVVKGYTVKRFVRLVPPDSPPLRPPCRTCDPTYNLFHIDDQYFIPNQSKIYIFTPSTLDVLPVEIDIGDCNPVQLYSVRDNVIWVQCALKDHLIEIVELRKKDNVTWSFHNSQNIPTTNSVSRNGLVLVQEKDGENVTFLYYGDKGILQRKGLKELSLHRYTKTSRRCRTIEELFIISDELILIQCALKDARTESGLTFFNTSNPSQSLTLIQHFHTSTIKVHVFEGLMVLLSNDTVIIRNAVNSIGIEQLVVLPPKLSLQGLFVRVKDTIYFVCTNEVEVYFIDISKVMAGNITGYTKIETPHKICTDVTCSPIQYMEPLLFIPLETNELALYYVDPIEYFTTTDILGSHYRYFFTYSIPQMVINPTGDINGSNTLQEGVDTAPKKTKSGPSNGMIGGVATTAFVIIVFVFVIIILWHRYYRIRSRLVHLV